MKFISLLLATFAFLLSGCDGGGSGAGSLVNAPGDPPDTADISNRLYVVAAGNGSAASAGNRDYTITLEKVQPEVDWYTDRPDRETGDENTKAFIDSSWQRVYAGIPPNALLQYRNAAGVQAMFGAVRNVAYNAQAATLRFTLNLEEAAGDPANGAGSFEVPVLTLLNNLEPPAEGSSFALYAGQTSLVAGAQGGFRLVLDGVDEEVFWMNHAPSRSADFEPVGNFINYWPERFADSAPNASLAGDPGQGNYDILPLTLSDPIYDAANNSVSFAAVPLRGPGTPDISAVLKNAVLFVDAGERGSPSAVFDRQWRGVAYSAIPANYINAPLQPAPFFDSDASAADFQALWGEKDGCGRNDLQAMADAGINLIRLYDYNYLRGSQKWETAGNGHIPFLDKAQSLGIKVIIPISNYNFGSDGDNPWGRIEKTVTEIVNSTRKNGVIHPAVHSFSVGNELDLPKSQNMTWETQIPRAVEVTKLLHGLAPDHYITIPISNWEEKRFYEMFRASLPAALYQTRFYNSVQAFQNHDGMLNNILRPYDPLGLGVPLVITELGSSHYKEDPETGQGQLIINEKIETVLGQARAVRGYMDSNPDTLVKGFAIFEWQNSNWKLGGKPINAESNFGINAYGDVICHSKTGVFGMTGPDGNWVHFHGEDTYQVDRLVPLTGPGYPNGLLNELSVYFK